MSTESEQFNRELDAFAAQLGAEGDGEVVELVKNILDDLCTHTRIDTGQAKGSYVASLNAPVYQTERGRRSETEAVAQSVATADNVRGFTPGQTIYIANGAPYISFLNDGGVHETGGGFRGPGKRDYGAPDAMFDLAKAKYEQDGLQIDIVRG